MTSALFHCSIRQLRRTEKTRSDKRPSALAACRYIKRKGEYSPKKLAKARRKHEKEERLVMSGTFSMPAWAKGPEGDEVLWKMADEYERANGRLALKIEFAIPRDIPRNRWADLTKEICTRQFYGHPLSFAVHEGQATDGKTNPHIHILVSERALDGVERSPEQFFRQANKKRPSTGGAAKDRRWHDKGFFHEVRKSWADLCNEFLVSSNALSRVDHRSNESRGIAKAPGVHEGPTRLAMKARGVKVRPRYSRTVARELAAANQRERFELSSEIYRLEKIERILNMPVNKPITSDHDNLPMAHVAITGLKCSPRQPGEVREYVNAFFDSFGFEVIWASAPIPQNRAGYELLAWRAVDRNDPTRQVAFDGNDTFTATQEDEASLLAIVEGLKAAGFKGAILSGSDKAIARMAELCQMHGIRVHNNLPDSGGNGAPPLPPPQPLTAAPKPRKSQKELEKIYLQIRREIWPDSEYRMPALWRRRRGFDIEIPGKYPHDRARNAQGADHLDWKTQNNQLSTSTGLLEAGIAATTYHLVVEQGLSLDQIHCEEPYSANRQDGGPPRLGAKLCRAFLLTEERTGIALNPALKAAILKAEEERTRAKERESQLEKQKDQSKTKELRIDLEPQ